MAVTKNTGRLAVAIAVQILAVVFLFGPRLSAAQQKPAPAPAAQAPAKINASVYRNSAVPPNPANPAGPVQPIPYSTSCTSPWAFNAPCATRIPATAR